MWPFINLKQYRSEILEAIKEIDRSACVNYMTEQLKARYFTEYSDGAFELIGDRTFRVVFSCRGGGNVSTMPMQIIHDPKGDGNWRKYEEYLNLYSISQILFAYTQLTGKSL